MRISSSNLSFVAGVVVAAILGMGAGVSHADWEQLAKLHFPPPLGAPGDEFGWDVAVDTDWAVIGAPEADDAATNAGSAMIFHRSDGGTPADPSDDWWGALALLVASDAEEDDDFGVSVAIFGEWAVVGAPLDEELLGAAYVYHFNGVTWTQFQKLAPTDNPDVYRIFGQSVAIHGDTIVVGAPYDWDNQALSGAAYVYHYNGSTWVEQIKLHASDGVYEDLFGNYVDVFGDVIVIGAPLVHNENGADAGAAYVFRRGGSIWVEEQKLIAPDGAPGDHFARVAIDGDTIIVGAPGDDDDTGSAYVFQDTGLSWAYRAKLTASTALPGDFFGIDVALSDDVALIGAYGDDGAGEDAGAAYAFRRDSNSTPEDPSDDVWMEEERLQPNHPDAGDSFGLRVSLVGETAMIGAYGDDDIGPNSGAAYVFRGKCFDLDEDGLCDDWEIDGIDVNGDSIIDFVLPGADPLHKDLYVEIDAMDTLAPDPNVLPQVVTAFANAPVSNPDGVDGINLHLELDETDIPVQGFPDDWVQFDAVKALRWGTPSQRSDPNHEQILSAKRMAYRYCIFGESHGPDTSSGLAELPGNDFMVTLGLWTTPGGRPDQQAATLMHEFGHALGLRHGGCDHINYKPNFYSIMNYTWQIRIPQSWVNSQPALQPFRDSWQLDYSRSELPMLDETCLDETVGIGGDPNNYVVVGPPQFPLAERVECMGGPVDWNHDGDANEVCVFTDINRFYTSVWPSPGEVLEGYDDWSNLRYRLAGHPDFADGVHTNPGHDEMTLEMFQMMFSGLIGDLNGDCVVDLSDLATLLAAYGSCLGDAEYRPEADFDCNDRVELADLATLLAHYGETCE